MGRTKIDCCKRDCPMRHTACWQDCPEYKRQRAELDESNQARANEVHADRDISRVQYTSYRMAKQAKHKREKRGRK